MRGDTRQLRSEPTADAAALPERFALTPRLACAALTRALGDLDPDAATACFAPDACLIGPDGTSLHGTAAIRAYLAQLIEARVQVAIDIAGVLVAADLALAHERWSIGSEGSSGPSSAHTAHPTLLLRQIAGEWKLAIAAPWGWAPAPPLQAI